MRKSTFALSVVCVMCFPVLALCQTEQHQLILSRYESALVSGFPFAFWVEERYHRPDPDYLERDRGWKNPVDGAARSLLHNGLFQDKEKLPQTLSDILRTAVTLYPLLYFPRQNEPRYEFHSQPFNRLDDAAFFVSYAESQAVNLLATSLTKVLARRHRPWVSYRNFDSPFYKGADPATGNQSFFSGHTSAAFAAASFHHRMLQRFRGKGFGDAEVWGMYLAAALTGLLRISADKHYLTDVLTGAAVGTLTAKWVVDISDYEVIGPGAVANATAVPVFSFVFRLP